MKLVEIIHKEDLKPLIAMITKEDVLCFYMSDDYFSYLDLRNKFSDKDKLKDLGGLFQETFQEVKKHCIELSSEINKRYNSFEWWGYRIASRNISSTPLFRNINYLFCAKKILLKSPDKVIFIVDSYALGDCIAAHARGIGYNAKCYRFRIKKFIKTGRQWIYYGLQTFYFLWKVMQQRRYAFKYLKPVSARKSEAKKRIIIRSWLTNNTFDGSEKFFDRNFGVLPSWLRSNHYDVWVLPMFFNIKIPFEQLYSNLSTQDQSFLLPEHYLTFFDYLMILYSGYKKVVKRITNAKILEMDVSPIFNETLRAGLDTYGLSLNLCSPLLMRLKEKGFGIDAFYYAFENDSPEKQFILSCRKYFPNASLIGFQHTTYFSDQLSHYFLDDEKYYHPLPDKIICSGPIYYKLHKESGFPENLLKPGPNLRFGNIYLPKKEPRYVSGNGAKTLLLPLTFSHDLAFEVFLKLNDALKGLSGFKILIRRYPSLSKKLLTTFLDRIGMKNYEFAENGLIQEWLPNTFALITSGGSVTALEAVIYGIPLIRIIPDNTFFHDPFIWPDYPFKPVKTAIEIRQQLQAIGEIINNGKVSFAEIGNRVMEEYYTRPNNDNMRVFL